MTRFRGFDPAPELVDLDRLDAQHLGDLPRDTMPGDGAPAFDEEDRAGSDRRSSR
jgi:hypothetical protein